jgi:hypothetical protein
MDGRSSGERLKQEYAAGAGRSSVGGVNKEVPWIGHEMEWLSEGGEVGWVVVDDKEMTARTAHTLIRPGDVPSAQRQTNASRERVWLCEVRALYCCL